MTDDWSEGRIRANLPLCTQVMHEVMGRLIDVADKHDMPFIYLDGVHGRTLNALIRRDWIVRSVSNPREQLDRPRYKITGRGRHAHRIYGIPTSEYDQRHFDGLCPACRERPKIKTPGGADYGYCEPCLIKQRRRKRWSNKQKDPNGLCPMCGKRKRHITTSGNVRSYCLPCRRQRNKQARKRYNDDLLRRIREEGYQKWCSRCHQNEVYITGTTVTDYCYDCYREYQNEYYWRKKRNAVNT